MSTYEQSNFKINYRSELFKSKDDNYQRAESNRKLLVLSHSASCTLAGADTTCLLLENNLNAYTKIVDKKSESGDVNNYAEYCLSLASKCKNKPDVKSWKSIADTIKPDLTEMFNCNKGQYGCKSRKVTHDDLKVLLDGCNGKAMIASEPIPRNSLQLAEQPDLQKHSINVPLTQPKLFSLKTSKSNTYVKSTETNNDFRPTHTVYNVKSKLLLPTKNHSPPEIPSKQFHPRGLLQNNTNTDRFNNHLSVEDQVGIPKEYNSFHSARNELRLQNSKKFGSNSNQSSSNYPNPYSYGSGKRSLGARRGVQNKFVPPVRPVNEENQPNQTSQEQIPQEPISEEDCDERLRNIDPKMIELIRSEIMDSRTSVDWGDIAGLEFAKSSLQESVVWPLLRPDIFTGLRQPPKGILLFGPPGTGKTLIGKCIASQSGSTFFSISASSLTSKWVGDGEKMVRALFAVATVHQPSVVFIDEIDSLLSQRSSEEHESSRRIKTEFLVQLDGATTGAEDRVLVVGATNRPQELDEAARRRLVKRLYIPLPERNARMQIVDKLMASEQHNLSVEQVNEISELCNGYSGSDMKNLCQEASLGPIRNIDFRAIKNITPDQVRPINVDDFRTALIRVRASVSVNDLNQYIEWDKLYGSGQ